MSLKHPHIIYWVLSIISIILTVLAVVNFQQIDDQHEEWIQPIDVTTAFEVTPGRYYQTNGQYHLDTDGVSILTLPFKKLPENINQYNTLLISNLDNVQTTHVYLSAQIINEHNEEPIYFKQKLINSRQSINILWQEWRSATKISDVALVVEPNASLGFGHPSGNEVSWQMIQFTDHNQIKQGHHLLSNLSAFVPLNYSSINVHNGESISIYKTMLMVIGVWLITSVILFFIIKPAIIHLLMSIVLAWFLASVFYGYNFSQQTHFNHQRFAEHGAHLNQSDRQLAAMADRINKVISKRPKTEPVKIMIIGTNDFDRNRLNFHLLQHNVGIVADQEVLMNNLKKNNSFAVLLPPFNKVCDNDQETTTETFNILLKTNRFCLVQ